MYNVIGPRGVYEEWEGELGASDRGGSVDGHIHTTFTHTLAHTHAALSRTSESYHMLCRLLGVSAPLNV